MSRDTPEPQAVLAYLLELQERICAQVGEVDPTARFVKDDWERAEGGGGITRAVEGGEVFEKGGVSFSDVRGGNLPPSATAHRPELRSEEHTSELQSLAKLVCRLLLEKKKKEHRRARQHTIQQLP